MGEIWKERWANLKNELEELGLTKKQTKAVMFKIHDLIDSIKGYHYENIATSSKNDLDEMFGVKSG